ncbi:methoxymalonate biosynthesis acyl carrier protein [Gammaproteobacteria bacterium]
MSIIAIENAVRDFLGKFISDQDVDGEQDLFASGMVNSLFAMQLVLFVEKQYGITVANEDLNYENFKSVNAIVAFIQSKK